MKRILFSLIIGFIALPSFAQKFPSYTFDEFEPLLHQKNDTVYVINFWATWCAPCIKEIPHFNQAVTKYKDKPVVFYMVSLDFGNKVNDRLANFQSKHKMIATIWHLDDPDSNSWINKVDPEWSGALPATLIYRNDDASFYEKAFEGSELNQAIESKLK